MPEHSELLAMLSAEYGITPEKIMDRYHGKDRVTILWVTPDDLKKVLDRYAKDKKTFDAGLICYEDGWFTVCAAYSECFCEQFRYEAPAIRYLLGDYDNIEKLQRDGERIYQAAMKKKAKREAKQ